MESALFVNKEYLFGVCTDPKNNNADTAKDGMKAKTDVGAKVGKIETVAWAVSVERRG